MLCSREKLTALWIMYQISCLGLVPITVVCLPLLLQQTTKIVIRSPFKEEIYILRQLCRFNFCRNDLK
jgi:hypothetical protein